MTDMQKSYEIAQSILSATLGVKNAVVYPHWSDDSQFFWYPRVGDHGEEYCLVRAETGEVAVCVTRSTLIAALAAHLDVEIDSDKLLISNISLCLKVLEFSAFGQFFAYDLKTKLISAAQPAFNQNWVSDPAGHRAILCKDDNLWLRDLQTGDEKPLTSDGTDFHSYGVPPLTARAARAAFGGVRPEVRWSPDGRYIFSIQTDDRDVGDLPLMEFAPYGSVRPNVHPGKVALPGDPKVTQFRLFILDVESGKETEAKYPRLSAVRMNDSPFSAGLAWWSDDSQTAYFVDIERGEKQAHVVAVDAKTGATRLVFSEQSDTALELSVNVYAPALVFPVAGTEQLIWYSERTGHGHLYLYDLSSGKLINPITEGDWQLREVLHIDEKKRQIILLAAGIGDEEDPYICKPCIASLDGGDVGVLSGAPGEHVVWRPGEFGLMSALALGLDPNRIAGVAPTGEYFIETVGTIAALPETFLRRRSGELIGTLEAPVEADLPDHWLWPEPVKLRAADDETDIFGIVIRPPNFDPSERYPVIDYVYGGPQVNCVPKIAFGSLIATATLANAAHLAALGAIVIIIDGRGTACREKAFRTASYGNIQTASNVEDHIAGLKELAAHDSSMDLSRVGICGFSGGGYMTAFAAARHGDFYKVAVAGGGNYDQNIFWHSWGERYHGDYSPEHYAKQAVKTHVHEMSGKLLLIHGLMDAGCHPAGLMQLIQALVSANKDYDLVLLPKAGHELTSYGVRRQMDYFTQHLLGKTPPSGLQIELVSDGIAQRFAYSAVMPQKA